VEREQMETRAAEGVATVSRGVRSRFSTHEGMENRTEILGLFGATRWKKVRVSGSMVFLLQNVV
jgi:hypothetical protein